MSHLRIALIGAGSVVFTRVLVEDLLSFSELHGCELALHDIDPERLDVASRLLQQVTGADTRRVRIEACADRRAALQGADYVINMVQIGGHEATRADLEIPARWGLRQTIGDTIGVGGIFRALRTFPFLDALLEDMRRCCPDALLLNYTNPMAMLCRYAAVRAPEIRVVGLCHSVQHTVARLAGLLGLDPADVTFLSAGVNHQAFLLRLEHAGRDLYPRLDEVIARDPELRRTVRVELYRHLGYFQTESSEHAAEYLPWFLRDDDAVARFRLEESEYLRRSQANLDRYAETRARLDAGADLPGEDRAGVEYAPRMIHAIRTGAPVVVYGNVPNGGAIANLPAEACVEVPCLVDRSGVRPAGVGALPPQCVALNRQFVSVCELTVQAAVQGRRDHVLHAAMIDPNTAGSLTLDATRAVVDALFAHHDAALPESLRG